MQGTSEAIKRYDACIADITSRVNKEFSAILARNDTLYEACLEISIRLDCSMCPVDGEKGGCMEEGVSCVSALERWFGGEDYEM